MFKGSTGQAPKRTSSRGAVPVNNLLDRNRNSKVTFLRDEAAESTELVEEIEDISDDDLYDSIVDLSLVEIFNLKKFDKMLKRPGKGSLLSHIQKNQRKGKKAMNSYFQNKVLPEILGVVVNKDASVAGFAVTRLFADQRISILIAEKVKAFCDEHETDDYTVVFDLFGMEIKDRSELTNVLPKIFSYHPWLKSLVQGFMNNQ